MSHNPLTIAKYYIFESVPWPTCTPSTTTPSYVSTAGSPENFIPNGPMNLFNVSEYIQGQITLFIQQIQVAGTCELTKKEILTDRKSGKVMPENCSDFARYTYPTPLKYGVFRYRKSDTLWNYKVPRQDRKNLCQRIADLNYLLSSFNEILMQLDLTGYPDYRDSIISTGKNNANLRKELDMQLQLLYSDDHNIMKDNVMKLDSAIYATVLWSILASSLAYYVFIKL